MTRLGTGSGKLRECASVARVSFLIKHSFFLSYAAINEGC